jgi:hypothetical protein
MHVVDAALQRDGELDQVAASAAEQVCCAAPEAAQLERQPR